VTELRADEHFDALREPVWARFRGRHQSRELFEDCWSEFWLRESERAAAGRPSHADSPVAFITEALHRIAIDQARARGRGLSRDSKHLLEVHDLDDQHHLGAPDDADFNMLVHRVLDLVEASLTERERRVFVACFLYLLSTPQAAVELGLSEPRVKKDRLRILEKVGVAVWPVLAGELGCSATRTADPAAGFELMAAHVEECERCAGLRRGALAVVGPIELLALPGLLDQLSARFAGAAQRVGELATSVPPAGRTAAVAGLAAAALAGGAVTSAKPEPHDARPAPVVVAAPTPVSTATARPLPTATPTPVQRRVHQRPRKHPRPRAVTASAPALRAPPPPVVQPAATPRPQTGTGEFGFEHD
jgi:RNA polymerase sigma factor (sigma-70 family)